MAIDAKGNEVFAGDEIVTRCIVKDVQNDHVLTTTVEAPHREVWFQASVVERTVQGPHSKSKSGPAANNTAPSQPKSKDEIAMDAGIAKAKELRAKSKSTTTAAH